jgi:hypothetical protein
MKPANPVTCLVIDGSGDIFGQVSSILDETIPSPIMVVKGVH